VNFVRRLRMEQIVARCGFKCDECMAYVANNHSYDDQVKVASAWSKYFGLEVPADKLRCNGCRGERCADHNLPEASCPISACVVERGMNTCADCIDFPCEKMESRMKGVEEVIARFRAGLARGEYDEYIAPYDSRKTLNEIRDRRVDRID
jgi:Protein of unknown function (DUF3795)